MSQIKALKTAAFITLGGGERKEFLAEVEHLTTSWAALKSSRATDVKWCQPRLAVRVKHLAGSKTLRHATVKGFLSLACCLHPVGGVLQRHHISHVAVLELHDLLDHCER